VSASLDGAPAVALDQGRACWSAAAALGYQRAAALLDGRQVGRLRPAVPAQATEGAWMVRVLRGLVPAHARQAARSRAQSAASTVQEWAEAAVTLAKAGGVQKEFGRDEAVVAPAERGSRWFAREDGWARSLPQTEADAMAQSCAVLPPVQWRLPRSG
jgi:hypothetical protein